MCVVPGSACGCPGYVRVAFANLDEHACEQAAGQLKTGLQQLVGQGTKAMQESHTSQKAVGGTAAPCEDV